MAEFQLNEQIVELPDNWSQVTFERFLGFAQICKNYIGSLKKWRIYPLKKCSASKIKKSYRGYEIFQRLKKDRQKNAKKTLKKHFKKPLKH